MNRTQAKKALKGYAEWMLPCMLESLEDQQKHEHGGWDEVEGDDAKALVTLGLTGSAEACRDHLIEFLKTPKALKLLERYIQPNFDYAEGNLGDDDE